MNQSDLAARSLQSGRADPQPAQQQDAAQASSPARRAHLMRLERKAAGPLPAPSVQRKDEYGAGYSADKGVSAHYSHDDETSDGMTTVKGHRDVGYDDK